MIEGTSAARAPDQFVAVDIETTGGSTERDRIIEIALIAFRHGEVIHRWQSFVNPGRPIPAMITRLTGISQHHVQHAPPFERMAAFVHRYLARAGTVVAHNLQPIEKRQMGAELSRSGLIWPVGIQEICTLEEARALRRVGLLQSEKLKLNALCDALGVNLGRHHRAAADAEACGWCLLEMDRLRTLC